jgi:hypothetical protein
VALQRSGGSNKGIAVHGAAAGGCNIDNRMKLQQAELEEMT